MQSYSTRILKDKDSNIKLKQMNMMKMRSLTASIGLLATSTQMASAASIALANAGFETDDVPANGNLQAAPTSWIAVPSVGLEYLGDGATFPGISGGQGGSDQFFLAANGNSIIRQDSSLLWTSLSAGDTLTVSAWTTYRSDINPGTDTSAYLWINDGDASGFNSGAINVTTAGELGGGATVDAGAWTQRAWTYTVTQDNLDTAINDNWGAVEVQIGMLGGAQIAFDNVTLDHSAVPEPSGLALCGAGLGIMLLRRKRHA